MANILESKRLQVDKETKSMIIAAAIAAFVVMFCIFSAHSLLTVLSYQNRVINIQSAALNTLNKDITTSNHLATSYTTFNNSTGNNLLGASSTGTGPNQGDNAKLVLDALPSTNDYSAMVVNIQNLFNNQGVTLTSLEISNSESTATTAAPVTTTPVSIGGAKPISFSFTVTGPLSSIDNLIQHLHKSILPIQFEIITLSGDQNKLSMTATAQTYYQPAISFNITTETVK